MELNKNGKTVILYAEKILNLVDEIETFCIVNNIINFWKTSLNKKSNFKQNYEKRKRFKKIVDFTLSNKEFTALGHMRLFRGNKKN